MRRGGQRSRFTGPMQSGGKGCQGGLRVDIEGLPSHLKHCIQFKIITIDPTRKLFQKHLLANATRRQARNANSTYRFGSPALKPNSGTDPCYSESSQPSANTVVGYPFALAACLYIDYYPIYVYNCDWGGVPDSAVGSYTWDRQASESTPVQTQTADNVLFAYFTKNGSPVIRASCDYEYYYGSGSYEWPPFPVSVTEPAPNVSVSYGKVNLDMKYPGYTNYDTLHWGLPDFGDGSINWTYSVSNVQQSGSIAVFQLIQSVRARPKFTNQTPPGQICSDTNIPYAKHTVGAGATYKLFDAPEMPFGPDVKKFYGPSSINETYWDVFVYKPDTPPSDQNGIWTRLSHLSYAWQASVDYEKSGWNWTQKPQLSEQQPSAGDGLPGMWTCTIGNGGG
jgi:hypothetical protein